MSTWLDVATIAFIAQLTVLPGEKGQFIIAALATRYHPLVVVSAAGAAFGGWTVLEIQFGRFLQQTVSPGTIELFTGLLFVLFALFLVRAAPGTTVHGGDSIIQPDGGPVPKDAETLRVEIPLVRSQVPHWFGGWLPIFVMLAAGEFGDKTQFITIGLAAKYAAGTAIWVGEMAAIIPISLANAYLFHRFSGRFDARLAYLASAVVLAFFGLDTLQATVTGVSVWEATVGSLATVIGGLLR
jgi:putative Ca2+/H+ antiporter (TMEM165/GDT1 family)